MSARYALKSVKVYRAMSEETTCFTATITFDGKAIGTAQNRGHGGNTDVRLTAPLSPVQRAVALAMLDGSWMAEFRKEGDRSQDDGNLIEDVADVLIDMHQQEQDAKRTAKAEARIVAKNTAQGFPVTYRRDTNRGFEYRALRSAMALPVLMERTGTSAEVWTLVEAR